MKISILCSSTAHPVYPLLDQWCERQRKHHETELKTRSGELSGGDLLFLISCSEIVKSDVRGRYRASLVVHASDLPAGRGWSPLVWQILDGRSDIAVSLLEAEDEVDSGALWHQVWLHFEGHELADEINAALFAAELELMDFAVAQFGNVKPRAQAAAGATWYRKRTPDDSRVDPARPLADQFDLLRVADAERYPAFFEHRGHRYVITVKKVDAS